MPAPQSTQSRQALGARSHQPAVAVVGGGLAGLAAGCALSESGFRVTLFERRPYLGGRASSYEHPATGETVDNCQHVLFGCCTNLIAFYRKIGIEDKIRWFERMTFIEPGGRQSVLEATSLPAPFHVMPAFLGFKFLNAWDKIALSRALIGLIRGGQKNADQGTSFHQWLRRHHQTENAIERFWKPILISALSEDLDRISVPYAAQVVRESMKSRDARTMGIPRVPLSELYDSARDYILAHGGAVRLRNRVQSFVPGESGVRVKVQDLEEEFDYAVLAVASDWLGKLLPDLAEARELREKVSHFETSPITGVHLWFDRQITDLPHAVLLDRTIQWMFHKSLLLAKHSATEDERKIADRKVQNADSNYESGLGPGDRSSRGTANDESTGHNPAPAGRRSLAGGESPARASGGTESRRNDTDYGSYVELVISSSKSLIEKSRQEIIDLALEELREFFPSAWDATLVKATVVKELNATFSPTPGIDRYRPNSQSPWSRVFLAGDWTATGWPATMESAVRSGYLAGEALAKSAGSESRFLVPDLESGVLLRFLG